MNFQFFLEKIALPLLAGGAVLLLSNFGSSLATGEDLYKHKMENVQHFAELNAKLDFMIKSQVILEKTVEKMSDKLDRQ